MLPFIRSDIAQIKAYTPNPGEVSEVTIDRLDTNENPFDLPIEIKEKLAWTYQQLIEANRYPDGGHGILKGAIASYVSENLSSPIRIENISVGNGSDELIRSLLIATCLGGEGSILVANPTFSMYAIIAQTLGIPVVSVGRKETNFEINLEEAQSAMRRPPQGVALTQNPPIRVVFVVHPNSPTANALTASELEWLRSLPEEILVVIDEAYFEFSQTSLVGELPQRANWVILRTFSKAFRLAAHRIGYAIAHPELTAALEKVRLPYNLPTFTQAAAQIALAHRQLLLQSIPEIIAEREKLMSALAQHPGLQVWPSAANFIYLRPKLSETDSKSDALAAIAKGMKELGTLVRYTGGGIRITVGSAEENLRTLDRLYQVLV